MAIEITKKGKSRGGRPRGFDPVKYRRALTNLSKSPQGFRELVKLTGLSSRTVAKILRSALKAGLVGVNYHGARSIYSITPKGRDIASPLLFKGWWANGRPHVDEFFSKLGDESYVGLPPPITVAAFLLEKYPSLRLSESFLPRTIDWMTYSRRPPTLKEVLRKLDKALTRFYVRIKQAKASYKWYEEIMKHYIPEEEVLSRVWYAFTAGKICVKCLRDNNLSRMVRMQRQFVCETCKRRVKRPGFSMKLRTEWEDFLSNRRALKVGPILFKW